MTEMTIRDFEAADEVAVLKLYRETPELHRNTPVDLLDENERRLGLSLPGKVFLVAVNAKGELAGFVYVKYKQGTINEEQARLLHAVVRRDERQSGLATRLEVEAEQRLKEMGVEMVYSNVNSVNTAMVQFLLRRGYRLVGTYLRFEKALTDRTRGLSYHELKDLGYYYEDADMH